MRKAVFILSFILIIFCAAIFVCACSDNNTKISNCAADHIFNKLNNVSDLKTAYENGGVEVNEVNFPDRVFREWILNSSNLSGTGSDCFLSEEELSNIKNITIRGSSDNYIENLKGIEYFSELTELSVPYNVLTSLDLDKNVKLSYLNCSYNRLKNLEITTLKDLKSLNCEFNYLKELDLSGNGSLTVLYSRHNLLESLDLTNNTKLVFIETFDNLLKEIDVSMLTDLEFLHIDHNKLTSLDMSKNLNLKGGGFVVRNNYMQKLILPEIKGFTIYYDDFAEQDPIKGYEKTQWYEDEDFTIPLTSDVEAKGQTLYAKRMPNCYTVIFNTDGANNTPDNIKTFYDTEISIPETIPVKTGYKFKNWSDDKYSDGTVYTPGQSVINLSGSRFDGEKFNLYAKWQGISYSISFDKNSENAEGNMSDFNAVYGSSYSLTENAFTRDGYDFEGWSYTRDGKAVFKDRQSFSNLTSEEGKVITLYAVWSENAETLQKPYLNDLKDSFDKHSSEEYYEEDFVYLSEIYSTAAENIKKAGKNTSFMSETVNQAKSSMNEILSKTKRAEEIEKIWRENHSDALNYVETKPVPYGTSKIYNTAVKNAYNAAEIQNLAKLSSLKNADSRENAAYNAKTLLNAYITNIKNFIKVSDWLIKAEDITALPLSKVLPEHTDVIENLIDEYNFFTEEEKEYILSQTAEETALRLKLASYKKTCILKAEDLLKETDEESLSAEKYYQIKLIAEETKQKILSSESEKEMDLLLTAASEKIDEIINLPDTEIPVPELPDNEVTDGEDKENYAFIIVIPFILSGAVSLIWFAVYLIFRNKTLKNLN